jgi:hypothetical protein
MSCARVVCTGHVANTRAERFPGSAVVGCMSSLSYEPQRQAPDTGNAEIRVIGTVSEVSAVQRSVGSRSAPNSADQS